MCNRRIYRDFGCDMHSLWALVSKLALTGYGARCISECKINRIISGLQIIGNPLCYWVLIQKAFASTDSVYKIETV